MTRAIFDDAKHFNLFTKVVKDAIAEYGHVAEEDLTEMQRQQVEELAELELKFRDALIRDPQGEDSYKFFVSFILDNKKNILVARPYFRHRRTSFVKDVSTAIRNRDIEKLKECHINYHFVNLIVSNFNFGPEVKKCILDIQNARQKLIVMNIPLVINRTSIFWSRMRKSHLSFMDLIQIGVEGLIAAIDKYCGEYTKVYRSVIIGRIVGNFIETGSSTMLHFYPGDKRKLYAANKFKARHVHGDYEVEDLINAVSDGKSKKVTEEEISSLMAASAVISADSSIVNDHGEEMHLTNILSKHNSPVEEQPDVLVETNQALSLMYKAISGLPLIDKKLLRLKGIDITLE